MGVVEEATGQGISSSPRRPIVFAELAVTSKPGSSSCIIVVRAATSTAIGRAVLRQTVGGP